MRRAFTLQMAKPVDLGAKAGAPWGLWCPGCEAYLCGAAGVPLTWGGWVAADTARRRFYPECPTCDHILLSDVVDPLPHLLDTSMGQGAGTVGRHGLWCRECKAWLCGPAGAPLEWRSFTQALSAMRDWHNNCDQGHALHVEQFA